MAPFHDSQDCFDPRLRGGGDGPKRSLSIISDCFDPRLRGGGDDQDQQADHLHPVSIHASAGEATMRFARRTRIVMFRSTPPRGRRQTAGIEGHLLDCFDPRLRGGGDRRTQHQADAGGSFDPRLRGGGDLQNHQALSASTGFDPRLRGGGDGKSRISIHFLGAFRSTPPRGRRRWLAGPLRHP